MDGWDDPSSGPMPAGAKGSLLPRQRLDFSDVAMSAATTVSHPELLDVLPAYECRK